jgi:dTDP-4-amino-4,6-dideoxygalactose transaminase
LSRSKKVRNWYTKKLDDIGISSIESSSDTISNNHKLVIRAQDRDGLKAFLDTKKIQTQIHYPQPMSRMKMFDTGQEMPNAEKFCQDVISLPIHPFLKKNEVLQVCNSIREYYGV